MTSPAQFFGIYLADLASDLGNRWVAQDPRLKSALEPLMNTAIEWQLTTPRSAWHITFDETGIRCHLGAHEQPTTRVMGSAPDMIAQLLGRPSNALKIEGDVTVLTTFVDLLKTHRPDPFSDLYDNGPEIARQIQDVVVLGTRALRSAMQGVTAEAQNASHQVFVNHDELNGLLERLETLRERVDRLAARIALKEHQS